MRAPRSGVTLIEVLIAVFVAAIGLIALVSLFPFGAVTMARALSNTRATQLVVDVASVSRALRLAEDPQVLHFMDRLNARLNNARDFDPPIGNGPGNPVYVDPVGSDAFALTPGSATIAGIPMDQGGIARVPFLQAVSNQYVTPPGIGPYMQSALAVSARFFKLPDDVRFAENADPQEIRSPLPTIPGDPDPRPIMQRIVQRENRFSSAVLLRRPNRNSPSVVEQTIVVYDGRSRSFPGETAFQNADFDASSRSLTFQLGAGQPRTGIKPGAWIFDATMFRPAGLPGTISNLPLWEPHGNFYRIVNVLDSPNPNTVVVELAANPKQSSFVVFGGNKLGYGVVVLMNDVLEVLETGPIR